jgi:hypothetical protein
MKKKARSKMSSFFVSHRESTAMSDTNAMTVLEMSRQESRPTVYIDLRHQPTPSGKIGLTQEVEQVDL